MLLSVKESTEPCQETGATPLYVACQNGHLDVVRMLLSTEGIDPNRALEMDRLLWYIGLPEGPSGSRAHAVKY